MERNNLKDELNLSEAKRVKRVNLGKAFDKLHSELKSVQGQVEKRFMELETREVELQSRSFAIDTIGELEVKADGLMKEIKDKEEVLMRLVKECTAMQGSKATLRRELDEEKERKTRDLTLVQEKVVECGELLETRSLELVSKEIELQGLNLDLDLRQEMANSLNNEMEETCQKMESKAKKLGDIERMIHKQSGHYESTKMLIEELTAELASKEKRHKEITESIHKLSCKQEERYIAEHESAKKELKYLKTILTERDKQVEEGKKQIQHLSNINKEHIRQLKRQEQFCSRQEHRNKVQKSVTDLIAERDSVRRKLRSLESLLNERKKQAEEGEKKIRECTDELEAKRKDCDQVQSSITELTVELKSKESHLGSVKKKIQESLEDLQAIEEHKVKLKASLVEQEQGLELRAKELDEKDKKLKATEHELAKDYEVKANQLSTFCKERKMEQRVALTPTENSRKRGRYDDESLSESLGMETHGKENTNNFENLRSQDKFKIDQIWAVYRDKGMPRKYGQIKRIDTSPEFKLHVAPLELYNPPNLTTHPVCCGRFKLKTGKAEVLSPRSFSHEVKAVKSNVNRFDIYPRKGEIWALYKNWNITNCADGSEEEELEIVEVVGTDQQSIQAMLLTAKVFNKVLYGRCLESKAGVVDIPKKEVNRFSHQIPAVRRERNATRLGDYEWWELDSKALLDLNPKKYKGIATEHRNIKVGFRRENSQMDWKRKWYAS